MMLLVLALACGDASQQAAAPATPEPMGPAECEVCGMLVREQPAPRGQVLHRDGTRAFACSLGDLRAHLAAPSPHGAATEVWVEVLPDGFDPAGSDTATQPWLAADQAHYVVGLERPLVMGRPVLAYATADQAAAAATATGGHRVTWAELRAAPLGQDPPAQGKKAPSK